MILVQLLTALLRLLLFLGSILQEMSRLALSRRSPAGNGTVLSWLLWVWSGTFCWVHFLTWSEDQERTVKRTGLVLQQSWSSCALTSWLEFMNFSGPELVEVLQTEAQVWMGPQVLLQCSHASDRADSWWMQTKTAVFVCACKNYWLSLKGIFNCICFWF